MKKIHERKELLNFNFSSRKIEINLSSLIMNSKDESFSLFRWVSQEIRRKVEINYNQENAWWKQDLTLILFVWFFRYSEPEFWRLLQLQHACISPTWTRTFTFTILWQCNWNWTRIWIGLWWISSTNLYSVFLGWQFYSNSFCGWIQYFIISRERKRRKIAKSKRWIV